MQILILLYQKLASASKIHNIRDFISDEIIEIFKEMEKQKGVGP